MIAVGRIARTSRGVFSMNKRLLLRRRRRLLFLLFLLGMGNDNGDKRRQSQSFRRLQRRFAVGSCVTIQRRILRLTSGGGVAMSSVISMNLFRRRGRGVHSHRIVVIVVADVVVVRRVVGFTAAGSRRGGKVRFDSHVTGGFGVVGSGSGSFGYLTVFFFVEVGIGSFGGTLTDFQFAQSLFFTTRG